MANEISEKKQDFEIALLNIDNIIEGNKIERFKFTPKELQTLSFISELLTAHIKELERY